MKTSAKYYHLTICYQGQVKVAKKSSTYDVTRKKPALQTKIFFKCKLQGLPRLLILGPGL